MAGVLAGLSGPAGRTMKTLAKRALEVDLVAGLGLETALVAADMRSRDAGEGLCAFVEKRTPPLA